MLFQVSESRISHLKSDWPLLEIRPYDSAEYTEFLEVMRGDMVEVAQWVGKTLYDAPLRIQPRMNYFWHQFVPCSIVDIGLVPIVLEQYATMQRHALGNLESMHTELTKGLAMQIALSGTENVWRETFDNTNENLARELLELYTLGRERFDGTTTYTQHDVKQLSYALSGWMIKDRSETTPTGLTYSWRNIHAVFEKSRWNPNPKTIFDETGSWNTDDAVHLIFTRRRRDAALWFCRRLYDEFVSPIPDIAFIEQMADVLLENDLETQPLLRQLFTSKQFYQPNFRLAIVRNPLEQYVGTMRMIGVTYVPDFHDPSGRLSRDLHLRLIALLGCPFFPQNVSGWRRDVGWLSSGSLQLRRVFLQQLAQGHVRFKDIPTERVCYQYDPLLLLDVVPHDNSARRFVELVGEWLLELSPTDSLVQDALDAMLQGAVEYSFPMNERTVLVELAVRRALEVLLISPRFQLG